MAEFPPQDYEDAWFRRMPRWMRGRWFDALWTTVSGTMDLALELAREASLAGAIQTCPDDAIEHHARARSLPRVTGETLEALRERLLGAWDFWAGLGTHANLEAACNLYASTGTSLHIYDQANHGWISTGVGGSFGDDTNTDNASREAIVIEQPHNWTRPIVGTGLIVGPGTLVGITMTQSELSAIRGPFRRFRPANIIGIDIFVILDSTPAEDILGAHDASGDYVRLPLHRSLVGYTDHNMSVGPTMIVGQEYV